MGLSEAFHATWDFKSSVLEGSTAGGAWESKELGSL